ncbi:MAG: hypothetical protein JSR24_00815 [Proteobacteria bacterium]|nr:hypothetical protein [Pseudomonadota bacterium]
MAAHALVLRLLKPAWRLPALPLLLLAAMGLVFAVVPAPQAPYSFVDGLVAFILAFSFGFAYALVMNGVIYDSPTLALVNAIEACGEAGMPVSDFDRFVARHPFVQSRLGALIAVGEIAVDGDELSLNGKIGPLLSLGDAYRRLRGGQPSEAG